MMNDAAMNIPAPIFSRACILVRVELWHYKTHMCMFSFSRCHLFARVISCFTLPSAMTSSCSASSSQLLLKVFHFSHSAKCTVILHWILICISLMTIKLRIFNYAYWPFVYPVWWNIVLVIFLSNGPSCYWFIVLFYIFWVWALC